MRMWSLTALDLWPVRGFGDAQGLAWRDHGLTRGDLHAGDRALG
jgi:hypothetical protein